MGFATHDVLKRLLGLIGLSLILALVLISCSTLEDMETRCRTYESCRPKCVSQCSTRYNTCQKWESGLSGVARPDEPTSAKECRSRYNSCRKTCNESCEQPELSRECKRIKNINNLVK